MIKILYIVSTLANKGPTNQLFNIVTNLDKRVFKPSILTLSPEPTDTQMEKFINANISIQSLNLSRIKGALIGSLYLQKRVKQLDPHIIHTQGLRADKLAAKKLSQYLTVTTLRNYPFHDYPMKFGKTKGLLMANSHINTFKNFNSAIACSESLATLLESKTGEHFEYIQNGVDTNYFTNTTLEEKKTIKKELDLPLGKNIFVTVGSLIPRKDPLTIINAFIQSEISVNSILLIIGDGPLRDECEEIAEIHSNIIFTGQVENVKDYLKASDYFVSASLSEGLPNTVLEALSVGLPCCLSNIEQHREIIRFNNNAAILTEPQDINKFANSLTLLSIKDYNTLTTSARKIADSYLSANIMAKKYEGLYKKLQNSI